MFISNSVSQYNRKKNNVIQALNKKQQKEQQCKIHQQKRKKQKAMRDMETMARRRDKEAELNRRSCNTRLECLGKWQKGECRSVFFNQLIPEDQHLSCILIYKPPAVMSKMEDQQFPSWMQWTSTNLWASGQSPLTQMKQK